MAARYQPQGLLRVARHPLTNGLRLAALPGVSRGYDSVTGKLPTIGGTRHFTSPTGIAAGFGSTYGAGASSDRVTTPLSGQFPSSGRTYAFRVRRDGTGAAGGGLSRIFDKTSGSAGQMLYWYNFRTSLCYGFYSGSTERVVDIPDTVNTAASGVWVDVVITHTHVENTSVISAWVNGQKVLSESAYAGILQDAPTTALTLGNRASDMVRGWDGLIEYAMVWDRALSVEEVVTFSANPYAVYEDASPAAVRAKETPTTTTVEASPSAKGSAGARVGTMTIYRSTPSASSTSITTCATASVLQSTPRTAGLSTAVTQSIAVWASEPIAYASSVATAGAVHLFVTSPSSSGTSGATGKAQQVYVVDCLSEGAARVCAETGTSLKAASSAVSNGKATAWSSGVAVWAASGMSNGSASVVGYSSAVDGSVLSPTTASSQGRAVGTAGTRVLVVTSPSAVGVSSSVSYTQQVSTATALSSASATVFSRTGATAGASAYAAGRSTAVVYTSPLPAPPMYTEHPTVRVAPIHSLVLHAEYEVYPWPTYSLVLKGKNAA